MNVLTLIARLTKDPELRQRAGNAICLMRVVESNGPGDSPLFINVAVFGAKAERHARSLSCGDQVAILGRLRLREWKADDDSRRSEYNIAAERIDILAMASNDDPDGESTDKANGRSASVPAPAKLA
jgi:single stranded DNA-binding protein